jgi:non-homologous end joining protein Ku
MSAKSRAAPLSRSQTVVLRSKEYSSRVSDLMAALKESLARVKQT